MPVQWRYFANSAKRRSSTAYVIRALGRFVLPIGKSFERDRHVTEDERKLNKKDFAEIREVFPEMEMVRFGLLSCADRFLRSPSSRRASVLEQIDYAIFRISNASPIRR